MPVWASRLTSEAIAAVLDGVGQRLRQIVVTHDHRDHSSGTVALLARWPDARCLKWLSSAELPTSPSWTPLQDGETIEAGDDRLLIVHTPGHAPDHICLWHELSRTLFGGDLLVEGGTIVVPGGRGGNLRQYLASLNRVAALEPLVVLPAHGEVIAAPAALIEQYRRAPGRARAAGRCCDCGRRGFRGGNRRPGVP